MATYDEMMVKAKELHASGDTDSAKRLAEIALKRKNEAAPKSFGQKVKENLLGDDDPTTQNFGEKVGTFLNKAGESMTFGLVGDEAGAAVESIVPGVDYEERRDHYRDQEALLEKTNSKTALSAEVLGALAAPVGALGAVGKGAHIGTKMLASGAATGAMSGIYGGMEAEGDIGDRAKAARDSAAVGAGIGAFVPVAGAGIERLVNSGIGKRAISKAAKNAPGTAELKALGQKLYKEVDDAGVQIKPSSYQSARDEIIDALRTKTGFDELPGPSGNTPKAARVVQTMDESLNAMSKDPTAALPFKALDQTRRRAASPMLSTDPVEQAAGREIISGIDDFVSRLGPEDVVSGDVKALQKALPKARETWALMSKSKLVEDASGLGEEAYLSGTGTGIKYQFKKILKNPKLSKGFTEAERKAMARVVNGTIPEQILRLAGSGLSQIGGTIAAGTAGGPLAGLGMLGVTKLAGKGSDALVNRNAEVVRALVANGGLKTLPKAPESVRKVIESLMRQGVARSQGGASKPLTLEATR